MMREKNSRQKSAVATIADVAREAGFSPMTVSRVINSESNVRDQTRNKVLDAVKKLNYAPNIAARTLAGSTAIRIGLLYSNPSAAYLSEFLVGSLTQAKTAHVQLIVAKCDPDKDDIEGAIELIESGVDGIILPPPLCDNLAIHKLLLDKDCLTVAVASGKPAPNVSSVSIDDFAAAATMTLHLLDQGHRRIGFIAGNPNQTASAKRLEGYKSVLTSAGIAIDDALIAGGLFTYKSGLVAADALLSLSDRPTAIFASNDDMAAATVAVAHRMDFEIPMDLTICGFDDSDISRTIWPELTTIHQPISDMSRQAVDLLVSNIRDKRAGKEFVPAKHIAEFTLVIRDSDAPPLFG
jgi:LacI family transcriptional regulator